LAATLGLPLAAACGGENPVPTSEAQATSRPADPTGTPRSAPTPTAPVTPTTPASASPTPFPTPTATPPPTPTPAPSPTASPARFVSPLTGTELESRPTKPLAVQISNELEARPQTGLHLADIVYETPTEDGVTRFTAFFGSVLPEEIGPVRSVRVVALAVIPAHDGILVYSGGSIDMTAAVFESGVPAIHAEGNGIEGSRRDTARSAPHNLYVSGPTTLRIAGELGFTGPSQAPPLTFGPAGQPGPQSGGVDIAFTAGAVSFRWDPVLERYQRFVDGLPHRDFPTGKPVLADNVVLLSAEFMDMDFVDDSDGETTLGVSLRGTGGATLLRDGQAHQAEWRRSQYTDPFRFYEPSESTELPLKPGQTWFAVIPAWLSAPVILP
jgi:hypothetical protein